MKKVFRELYADLEYINNENLLFHDHYKSHTGHGWAQWSEYKDWIGSNILTLNSISWLVKEKRYRDSYILLRPVLEAYLIIRLAMTGNVYFYDLLPKTINKVKESKSDLMTRATNDPLLVNNPDLIGKKLIGTKNKYFVRLLFKSRPVQNTNVYVARHYFLAKEYDPDSVYLSDLVVRNRWMGTNPITEERRQVNRNIKENFFEIGSLLNFFEVNKFVTPRQRKAFFAHYSYLSKYIHSTVYGYESISNNRTSYYSDNPLKIDRYNFYHELLCLLYSVFLSVYFIELQIEYFGSQPDLKLDKNYIASLRRKLREIKSKYSFFLVYL